MTVTSLRPLPVPTPEERPPSPPAKRAYSPIGAIGRRMRRAQELQLQLQRLEAELEKERDWFLAHMEKHNLAQMELGQFRVSLRCRHKWTYSDQLTLEMERIKADQKFEQSRKIAKDDPNFYVSMTTNPAKY